MKQLLLLCLIMMSPYTYGGKLKQQYPFAVYEGKYQMTINGKTGYLQIALKNKELTLTELWTGEQNLLKHLLGDNFIIELKGWAVKFNRDEKGNVVSVLIMGHDLWTKVK